MSFAGTVIDWQRERGRHDLPWQGSRDPYRVWLSEIMLQQTQVATVIPYYDRFLSRFPTLHALARASQEEVMPYWAGLGYYARARNLHRCARVIVDDWHGAFPKNADDIAKLPGIGPSTANAIAAFCYNARQPILDGNVKRVFCRYYGIEGETQKKATEAVLWERAWQHLEAVPDDIDMAAYTQGLMDLGATLCTRSKPACHRCPLAGHCVAKREGRQAQLPTPRQRKVVPLRQVCVLILEQNEQILMYRRADKGIWGGLLTLPEFRDRQACTAYLQQALGEHTAPVALAAFEHVFTHFRLHIEPLLLHAPALPAMLPPVGDEADQSSRWQWVALDTLADTALPAPLRKLLTGYFDETPNGASGTPRLF
ncbi:A/G-specific adenine glycosylase [Advenella mimigardefordensis]|uniref:Adenine DNA glycosylase n=1 Tax=Advenella mimigardefordensis (strain DSM 17166 / LMG 22922 / DPN7) TaxID=1247726 RepID=W0PD90_ADVMD|nr:A/G-specific adenine glycosylase [Advenella mimigardefordensis]AHG63008.1 A/G-specific adenine glycosylase [Advenella mimigardefordensis DPN7]